MTENDLSGILSGLEWTPGAVGIWLFGFTWLSAQAIKWFQQWLAWRKLTLEDKTAAREGFVAQVTHLTAENRALRHELTETRAEHRRERLEDRNERNADRAACEAETKQLRAELIAMQDRMSGMERARSAEQHGTARLLGNGIIDAPATAEAVERLAPILRRTVGEPEA